jgi:hypothetical protein
MHARQPQCRHPCATEVALLIQGADEAERAIAEYGGDATGQAVFRQAFAQPDLAQRLPAGELGIESGRIDAVESLGDGSESRSVAQHVERRHHVRSLRQASSLAHVGSFLVAGGHPSRRSSRSKELH